MWTHTHTHTETNKLIKMLIHTSLADDDDDDFINQFFSSTILKSKSLQMKNLSPISIFVVLLFMRNEQTD